MKKDRSQGKQSDPLKSYIYARHALSMTDSNLKAQQHQQKKAEHRLLQQSSRLMTFLANRVLILQLMNNDLKNIIDGHLSPDYRNNIDKRYNYHPLDQDTLKKLIRSCQVQNELNADSYEEQYKLFQNGQQIEANYAPELIEINGSESYANEYGNIPSNARNSSNASSRPEQIEIQDSLFKSGVCEQVEYRPQYKIDPTNLVSHTPVTRYQLDLQQQPNNSQIMEEQSDYSQSHKPVHLDLQNQKKLFKRVVEKQANHKVQKQLTRRQSTRIGRFVHQFLSQHLKFNPDVNHFYVPKKQILNMYYKWVYDNKETIYVPKESSVQMVLTNQLKIAFPSMQFYSGKNYRGIYFWKEQQQTGNNYKYTPSVAIKLEQMQNK